MQSATVNWMTGLLEGEGCFSQNRSTPAVIVGMTDKDVVSRVASVWGSNLRGPYRHRGSTKDVWTTAIHGSKAVGWMMTLYSGLGERRRSKIREILTTWRQTPVSPRLRTHCLRGHEFTPQNTRVYRERRHCRQCANEHARQTRNRNRS